MKVLENAVDQCRLRIGGDLMKRFVALLVLLIGEVDLDAAISGLRDFRFGVIRDRDVDRACARMEKIQRPEVEGAASEIGAHRRPHSDLVHVGSQAGPLH